MSVQPKSMVRSTTRPKPQHAAAGAAAILVLGLIPGCERSQRAGALEERSDSAGVQIIRVDEDAPRILPWEFVERRRVGGDDGGMTGFSRLSRWTVASAADHSLFILDPLNHRVVVLDSSGGVVRAMGGRGGGPGELARPTAIAFGPDSAVWVYDAGKGAMVRFGLDGVPLDERRIESRVWDPLRPALDGVYVGERSVVGAEMTRSVMRFSHAGESTVVGISLPRPAMVEVPGCQVSIPIGRLFERDLIWDAEGDRVAIFSGPEYVVDVYDGGNHTYSLRMSTPLRALTETLAARQYGDGFRIGLPGGDCRADAVAMVRAQGFESHLPAVSQLRVTPGGEIWVQRGHLTDEAAVIDIWAADGRYLGALPAGTPVPVAFLPASTVAVSEVDEWDVPRLVVQDVRRN
jgi:hypothetical protein